MAEDWYRFYKKTLLNPAQLGAELASKFLRGRFLERNEIFPTFYKAQIISFDPIGGKLENPSGAGSFSAFNPVSKASYSIPARIGPSNPPRSLRAMLISKQLDSCMPEEESRVYYPMFEAAGSDPVPGEFVYIFFDGDNKRMGVWMSKVAGLQGSSTNYSPGTEPYFAAANNNGGKSSLASTFGDGQQQQTNYATQTSVAGADPAASGKANLEYK